MTNDILIHGSVPLERVVLLALRSTPAIRNPGSRHKAWITGTEAHPTVLASVRAFRTCATRCMIVYAAAMRVASRD
jgi:hypothetical protein